MAEPKLVRLSPYQGLVPFTEKDATFFFGREKESRLIIANLHATPLTILYGPSGVGKSSVLQAGVAYQLNQRDNVIVLVMSNWKRAPLDRLKAMIGELTGLREQIDLNLPFDEFVAQYGSLSNKRVMIILDQFEEYFIYHPEEDEFTVQFSRAVMQPETPVSFLISIREEALARLDRFEGRIPILFDNYLRLEHMDDTSARSAITKPVEKYNELFSSKVSPIQIEEQLVENVLQQLKSGRVSLHETSLGRGEDKSTKPIEMPYLQLVMTKLWKEEISSRSHILHAATLQKLGGAEEIVRMHLDDVMGRLSSDHQLLASKVFQYLITSSGTKIALSASDLASFVDIPIPVIKSLLQRLSEPDVRLLRIIDPMNKIETSYEIFHDVLALPILDWRSRAQRRFMIKRRSSSLGLAAFLVVTIIVGLVYLLLYIGERYLGEGLGYEDQILLTLACSLPVLCIGTVFGIIGFMTGVNWFRVK